MLTKLGHAIYASSMALLALVHGVSQAIAAWKFRARRKLAAIEHAIYVHRMTLLALVAGGVLIHLCYLGHVAVDVAFLILVGPLFGWVEKRGDDRTEDRHDNLAAHTDGLTRQIEAIRGSGAVPGDLIADKALPTLETLFGREDGPAPQPPPMAK